jgi:hypothetical protein
MVTICCRTIRAKIGWGRIFLAGLNPVYVVVILVEFIVVKFVADQRAKQGEDGKPDYQICQVNHCEDLVVADVPENVDEKMINHGFESVVFCFSV